MKIVFLNQNIILIFVVAVDNVQINRLNLQ